MMQRNDLLAKAPISLTADRSVVSAVGNKVLRNTYMLLSMTLLFSALTAGIAMATNAAPLHWLITLGGYFGLLFVVTRLRDSAWGLAAVFALTGFLGYTLGPILNLYLSLPNGSQIVMTALGGTGVIFLALSGYAVVSRKDFSFMGGFLMVGILVAFLGGLGAMLFNVPMLSLAVSGMFVLLMSGMILWQTSEIIHGGETNYIMATVSLYITLFNLFISLLQILGVMSGDD
ncbi:MAG TPA: Bax inhibitor-1/YccA family protein [Candidatus Competibacter sp.]|nr:Bax inhibitor-1/YccA family protein [Candidatus Competibacter sp.]